MNAKGMSWVLGSTVRYSHFSRWSTTDVQKWTPYLIILRFRMIFLFPVTMTNYVPCKLCSALITDISFECCDHGELFIWHWIKGAQECVRVTSALFLKRSPFSESRCTVWVSLTVEQNQKCLFMMDVWYEGYILPTSCFFFHKSSLSVCFVLFECAFFVQPT